MPLYNDDVNLNDVGENDVITEAPQNDIDDESTNPQIVIDNPIEYDEIDFDDDDFQGGPGEAIPTITPPTELDPIGYANLVSKTFTSRITINDYSQTFLEDLYNQGAEFHVVYADGYDETIAWTEIVDPYQGTTETISSELLSLSEAIGQHFWLGDDGIHVTEAEEEDYLANHYGHGMLINSYGLLMTNNEFNLVGITQSAITFYDGIGNESTNITALFGPTTVIGRENKAHVQINFQGFDIYNKNEDSIATIKTLNDADGNLTATVLCHLTKNRYNDGTTTITLELADTGYKANSIISIRTNTDPSTVILSDPIVFSSTELYPSVYDIVFNQSDSRYDILEPYVDQDVRVTLLTTNLYNEYSFGVRNPNYQAGLNSFVVGETNSATGLGSFSHGMNNEALGSYAHAEGYDTYASGVGSHSEGYQTIAQAGYYGIAAYNHAEGYQTKARALGSHAEGSGSEVTAQGRYGHSEGVNTTVGYKKDRLPDEIQANLDRYYPIASYPNRTYDDYSTETTMSYTIYSDATKTNGLSFGANYRYDTTGMGAHAEGYNTEARADYSHAEGTDTIVDRLAYGSHAMGKGTIAKSNHCLVIGAYNNYAYDIDNGVNYYTTSPSGNYRARLFVIGSGSSDQNRRNVFTVDTDTTWIEQLECNNIRTCPYKVGDVLFTTNNYGTNGPTTTWIATYNQQTGEYTYPTWTKLTFTAISGVYAYKRVS